jgi:hypothetical protein
MRYLFAFLFTAVFIFCACDDRDDNVMRPNVRIENLSNQNFLFVQVRNENDSISYENIAPASISEYIAYDIAYKQDSLTIETDSTQLRFIPDSTSSPLPIGLYTYKVNINEEGQVEMTFRID